MQSKETIQMKQSIEEIITLLCDDCQGQINFMMRPTLLDCSHEDKTLRYAFPFADWMRNPTGSMHGGLVCTALDIAFGTLAVVMSGGKRCPTLSLTCNFLRPLLPGDTLIVEAECVSAGKSICHLTGRALSQQSGKVVATATAAFFSGTK